MGSLTRMRARNRLQTALEQRLATADTPAAKRAIYQDAVDRLCRIALADAEVDRLAREFAVNPESIAFPDSPGASALAAKSTAADTPERSGYEATCVDEHRLGDTVEATVRRYDDGAIILVDSATTESATSEPAETGVVILSTAQAAAFVRLVDLYAPQAADADASVDQLPTGSQHSLGTDLLGKEVLVERCSTTEIAFDAPARTQECLLHTDQVQDLYEYLNDVGVGHRLAVVDASAADADACATAPELTVDLVAAGWDPGEPCPACAHPIVHAIVRAGMQCHADGSWDYDETLAIYEAFCPECDWLPPVADRTRTSVLET